MVFAEDSIGNILGLIVNILSLISDISQIFHTIKYETTDGLSIIHIICEFFIGIFFLWYGIHLNLLMIISLNCSYLLCSSILFCYWIRNYRSRNYYDNPHERI